jgi:uncharacterized protein
MPSLARAAACTVGVASAVLTYSTLVEPNAYTVRRFDVPVLAPRSRPIRLLHVSDLHIVPGQHRKLAWIRRLAELAPDFVVNTGDTLAAPDGIAAVMHALEPLLAVPGAFVPGNSDYFAPRPKNPARYFKPDLTKGHGAPLPWPAMAEALADGGWLDLTHIRTKLTIGGVRVALAGTDDPHLKRARYEKIAGPADSDAAVRIGVTHSPEPDLLESFANDGYDLALAGHTHGGQVRIPFGPAIVTNCGLDVHRARWLHAWDEHMYFHVCAGLGTNPYLPIRFACRPEASLLTLVSRAA